MLLLLNLISVAIIFVRNVTWRRTLRSRTIFGNRKPFKHHKKCFLFHLKSSFCHDFLVMYQKGLIKKIEVNFKFCDVTAWLTNNCNTHIAQHFEMSDFVSHVCLQKFSVSCICNNDLLDFNRRVAESRCSTGFSCAFYWPLFFELAVLIPLVFYLIRSVSAEVSLNCISRIRFKCSFFWPWENQYKVHGFDSISITQFPAMIRRRLPKSCCSLNLDLSCFDFE